MSGLGGSRIPVRAAPSPSPAVRAANKIKRRSIGISAPAAPVAKRACPPNVMPPRGYLTTQNRATVPLPSTSTTGRATTMGIPRATAAASRPSSTSRLSTVTTSSRLSAATPRTARLSSSSSVTSRASASSARAPSPVPRENVAQLQRQIQEMQAQQDRLEQEKENAMQQLMDEKVKNATAQAEIVSQRTMAERFQGELINARVELGACQSEKAITQRAKEELEKRLAGTEQRLADTQRALCEKTGECTEHVSERRLLDEWLRELNETVIDCKGQIRVAVRVRPALAREKDMDASHLAYPTTTAIKFQQGKTTALFDFQKVFAPNMKQQCVFNEVKELLLSALHGFNVSLMAYGQTGSGKTHTMRGGDGEQAGVIPRAVAFLLDNEQRLAQLDWKFVFEASFLEVYNEEVYDLLNERNKLDAKLVNGVVHIDGLTKKAIKTLQQVDSVLAAADRLRSTAATKMNTESSRSHAIFTLHVNGTNEATGTTISSRLHLVDLAGSERAKDAGNEAGTTLFNEMTNINKGLSNLKAVLAAQLEKSTHIPYRNSKLTMLLSDSLGGGTSKTMVIVALNPSISHAAETKRSLELADQMSKTHIGVAKKQEK